jgi:hypothetical protein
MNAWSGRAFGALIAAALLAGCSGHSALMPSAQTFGDAAIIGGTKGFAPDACSDPSKLKVCIKPGGTYKLKITLTCKIGTQSASCGTVTWTTKMSNKSIKGKFKPNPGNPTTETITAAQSTKIGHYSQEVNAKCTGVPGCNFSQKGLIWIIK